MLPDTIKSCMPVKLHASADQCWKGIRKNISNKKISQSKYNMVIYLPPKAILFLSWKKLNLKKQSRMLLLKPNLKKVWLISYIKMGVPYQLSWVIRHHKAKDKNEIMKLCKEKLKKKNKKMVKEKSTQILNKDPPPWKRTLPRKIQKPHKVPDG